MHSPADRNVKAHLKSSLGTALAGLSVLPLPSCFLLLKQLLFWQAIPPLPWEFCLGKQIGTKQLSTLKYSNLIERDLQRSWSPTLVCVYLILFFPMWSQAVSVKFLLIRKVWWHPQIKKESMFTSMSPCGVLCPSSFTLFLSCKLRENCKFQSFYISFLS